MSYVGYRVGLSAELVKAVGVLGGLFVSFRYYQGFGDLIASRTSLGVGLTGAIAMGTLMGVVYGGLARGLRLFERLVKVTFEPKLNQMGGLVAGLLRAGLVMSMLLMALRQMPSEYLAASIEEHSLTGRPVSRVAPAVYDAASPVMGRFWKALRAVEP